MPAVRIEPDRQVIDQGTSAELRCIATGVPRPVVTWTKVGDELSRSVRIEGNVLRIENAVINDRGMYVCTAVNEVGKARDAAIVEVESKFYEFISNHLVTPGLFQRTRTSRG